MTVTQDADLFVEGERQLGQYDITVARYNNSRWGPTIPPLHVVVTNRRLFLRPQLRKAYPPAIIPSAYITKAQEVELNQRSGIMIALKTGHQLYIFINRVDGQRFLDDISAMKAKPLPVKFDHSIVEQDIQRLIDYINRL